jgi:hypothetical protein
VLAKSGGRRGDWQRAQADRGGAADGSRAEQA